MTLPTPNTETLRRLDEILDRPQGRRVGVLGLGISGRAMALYLAHRGARVVGADRRLDAADDELRAQCAELRLSAMSAETFADVEALAISPGADPRQPVVQSVLGRGAPVFGELELVRKKLPGSVVAITGTNGKSTTTALAGALVRACGLRAFVGGNLGDPIAAWADRDEGVDGAVLELSSFQLETAYRFEPRVAVILNVTPDHLDRYPDVASYAIAKQRILDNLTDQDVAVLSADDPLVVEMARSTRGRVWWFSTRGRAFDGDGALLAGDTMVFKGELAGLGRINLAHPRLFGRHNRENAMGAILAVTAIGLGRGRDGEKLLAGYQSFAGLEHRLELVAEQDGVRYINDSKATNDDAAAVALAAMDRPVVLLAGGRDKGGGYAHLASAAKDNVRLVVVFGEARDLIAGALGDHARVDVCGTMAEACEHAAREARSGEVVLLAPACSSFDEFKDYKHRGRAFKEWVETHIARRGVGGVKR